MPPICPFGQFEVGADGAPIRCSVHTGTGGCAAFNLRKTTSAVTQFYDTGLRDAGLRSTQFTILTAIAKSQPTSVAALTLMDATTMTRNLKLLAKAGLVDVSARGARRAKHVRLSKKGVRALARGLPLWRIIQERFEEAFGAGKWSRLQRQLELISLLLPPQTSMLDQR